MNPSVFIHCASEFSVSCAGLLETESIWGERQASLGHLHSCRVRDGSKRSKQHYRDVLLKDPVSSSPLDFSHPHTHAGKESWESRNKGNASLRPSYHQKSCYSAEKRNSCWAVFFVLLTGSGFLVLFRVGAPVSLPPGGVLLLPQWEHAGLSLPMPTVPQLPALPRLLLEGACRRFP